MDSKECKHLKCDCGKSAPEVLTRIEEIGKRWFWNKRNKKDGSLFSAKLSNDIWKTLRSYLKDG